MSFFNIVQLNEFLFIYLFFIGCLLVLTLESLDSLAFVLTVVSRMKDLLSCLMAIDLASTEARLAASLSKKKKNNEARLASFN